MSRRRFKYWLILVCYRGTAWTSFTIYPDFREFWVITFIQESSFSSIFILENSLSLFWWKIIGKFKLRLILCLQRIFDFLHLSFTAPRQNYNLFVQIFSISSFLHCYTSSSFSFSRFFAHSAIGCNLTRWFCFRYFCAWLFTSSSNTFLKSENIHQVKVWRELFFVFKMQSRRKLVRLQSQKLNISGPISIPVLGNLFQLAYYIKKTGSPQGAFKLIKEVLFFRFLIIRKQIILISPATRPNIHYLAGPIPGHSDLRLWVGRRSDGQERRKFRRSMESTCK